MLSRDDLQLTRRDRDLPALAELLDDQAAAEVIRQALPESAVRSVSGCYLRYKPGVSVLAAYLADTPVGPQHIHLTAYGRNGSDKLGKHLGGARRASPGDQNVFKPVVDAARALLVWPFPADDEVAALPAFASDDSTDDLWRRLALEEYLGSAPTWQIARYKPQRRFVAVAHSAAGPAGVLRLYSTARYGRARRAAKSLGRLADDALPGVLSHSDRHAALLMSWQPGATLGELLDTPNRVAVEAAFRQAGTLLAQLHVEVAGKLPLRELRSEAAALRQSAADLGRLAPDLSEIADRVAASCIEVLDQGTTRLATLHGDLHLNQLVVDARAARMIDLDGASVGEAALDLGNLRAHLERDAKDAGGNGGPETLWNALLAGYTEIAPPPTERRLAAWTAAAWLRLAHEPFRCRRSKWHDETAARLDRAWSCLQTLQSSRTSSSYASGMLASGRAGTGRHAPHDGLAGVREDASFRFAAAALDAGEADAMVSPLVRAFLGDPSWRLVGLRLARHKPARRFLVEYRYSNERGDETAVFGKVHVKPRHARSLALQQELLGRGFAEDAQDRIGVPAAVGVVPSWQMWLQQRVAGVDGWQLLAGPGAADTARQISDAVVKLQRSGLTPKRVRTRAEELEILRDRYERLGHARPDWRARLAALLAGCRELAASLPVGPLVPAHGDFYPDQLRGTGGRLWVLDHDLFCLADVHLDVGNFVGHLRELALRETSRRGPLRAASEAIVERFLQRHPAATRLGVEISATLTLARHVSISTQFEARRHATETILAECERRVRAYLEGAQAAASF